LGALALLILGELVCRVAITSPSNQIMNPQLGWVYMPHSGIFRGVEGGASLRLNAWGMNNDPIEQTQQRKMLVLGDSMTEALQVPRATNFVEKLNKLRPDFQWINGGQSGVGPAHYLALAARYKEVGASHLLVVFSRGDGSNLLRQAVVEKTTAEGIKIRVKPSGKDRLKQTLEPILHRSALATHLGRRFLPVIKGFIAPAKGPTQAWQEPHKHRPTIQRRLTAVLRELARNFVVHAAYIPELTYHKGSTSHERDWEEELFAAACSDAQVPMTRFVKPLTQLYLDEGQPGHGFANYRIGIGHLNSRGHATVAQTLASAVPR
jgi:hypothetical protein